MTRQLIVAGFHRSGTSLTAQILHRAGLFLGDSMLPENRSNSHGHFEDWEIVELHQKILEDNGLTWQVDGPSLPDVEESHHQRMRGISESRGAEHALWGFKDPRVCLFLREWKNLLPGAKVLLVYRNPVEACSSLHRRHANLMLHGRGKQHPHSRFWEAPDLALRMWLTHNRALLDFARAHPEDVMAVSLGMLREGFPLTGALNSRWDLGLREVPTAEVFDESVTTGRNGKQPVADEKLIGDALEVWEALEQLSGKTGELAGAPTASEQPTEEDFYTPSVSYSLLMENELLSIEARFLRDSFEEVRQERNELTQQKYETTRELVQASQERNQLQRQSNETTRELQQVRQERDRLQKQASERSQKLQQAEEQNSRLEELNSNLKAHNANLEAHYSSRRYELVDTLAETSLRIPGIKRLLRKDNE